MKIAISMEVTRVNTSPVLHMKSDIWNSAVNLEWYEFMAGHEISLFACLGPLPETDKFDLVIMTGGNDMPDVQTWRDNNYPPRDRFERQLVARCLETRTPILGICRGQHFLNWMSGGTHKLMTETYDNVDVDLPPFRVRCHHSVCIDQLAPGFECLLEDSAGVKELIIHRQNRWLGVGWHPERNVNKHTRDYILNLVTQL